MSHSKTIGTMGTIIDSKTPGPHRSHRHKIHTSKHSTVKNKKKERNDQQIYMSVSREGKF